MSDGEKKAGGDKAAEQATRPIKPEEVKVTVKPRQENLPKRDDPARKPTEDQNARNDKIAREKATPEATKEIREAVKQAAPQGREAQKAAADKAAQQVGEKLPKRVFKEVQVELPDEPTITKPATEGSDMHGPAAKEKP
jgi:hypothetical protein